MKTCLAAITFALLFGAVASAEIINLGLPGNNGGNGLAAYDLVEPGYTIHLSAGPATPGPAATLYWTSEGGYGVNYREGCVLGLCIPDFNPDEIERAETLTASFSIPVYLNSFEVSKYFDRPFDRENRGQFSINGGDWQNLGLGTSTGYKTIMGPGLGDPVTSLSFRVANGALGNEFAVRELDIVPTPEPSTAVLLATTGIGAFLLMRRRRKA